MKQNCQHNTYGNKCHKCKPGFIGDATRGTPFDCLPENSQLCNEYGSIVSSNSYCKCKVKIKIINSFKFIIIS